MGLARLGQQGNELERQRGRDGHGLLRRSRVRCEDSSRWEMVLTGGAGLSASTGEGLDSQGK